MATSTFHLPSASQSFPSNPARASAKAAAVMEHRPCRGASIAVRRLGEGSPILFAHCSSGTHREWLFAAQQLAPHHHCVLPDLLGYGDSSSHLDSEGRPVACDDVDVLQTLIETALEPVHVVAHSLGGAMALQAALRVPERVRSLLLVEPVAFQYLQNSKATRAEWQRILELARGIIDADQGGDPELAAQHFMGFWAGERQWARAPEKQKREVARTMSKVASEFRLVFDCDADPRALSRLAMPVTVISGAHSPTPARAVAQALARHVPGARWERIADAGHMIPFTHREAVMSLLRTHLAASGG